NDDSTYVMISVAGGNKYTFFISDKNRNPVTALSNTTVTFLKSNSNYNPSSFNLNYNIRT
ncbi:hypothetical protein NPIL_90811, partial [Nephila pilipes]